MRLGLLALSTVLLSGCSWMGGFGGGQSGYNSASYGGQHGSAYGHRSGAAGPAQGCQIYAPTQPIPRGCNPANVTLATQGGPGAFPQSPNFSGGQYVTGGYGSHVAQAGQGHSAHGSKARLRKPKIRGSFSIGAEKSLNGDFLDYKKYPISDPSATYNPNTFAEGQTSGSIPSGTVTNTVYSATVEDIERDNISFEDAHSTYLNIAGGLEYIVSPQTTLFGNVGYSYAQGENLQAITVNGTLTRTESVQNYDTDTNAPIGGPIVNRGEIPNQEIARFNYEIDDSKRLSLEAGGRHYFNPILKGQSNTAITPFVSASAGASHYNAQSFDVTQEQLIYQRAFDSNGMVSEFYNVNTGTTNTVNVYDSQWVPTGSVTTGMEWQVTPKTALAFETGLKIEGARKFINGERGSNNVSIPVTLRGSVNF